MALVTLPESLTPGTFEDVNDIEANLAELRDEINGLVEAINILDGSLTGADFGEFAAIALSKVEKSPSVMVSGGAQVINGLAQTPVDWTSATLESVAGMWDIGAPSLLVAPVNGLYIITCNIAWNGGTNLVRPRASVDISRANGTDGVMGSAAADNTNDSVHHSIALTTYLEAGDTARCLVFHEDAGTPETLLVAAGAPQMQMTLVSGQAYT